MQELDRRTRKTRKAINDAFWKLMREKDFEEITISDITETADIHRATFYLVLRSNSCMAFLLFDKF